MDKIGPEGPDAAGQGGAAANVGSFTTDELFRGSREIVISHRDALYRLKITRQGKLVLNK